MSDGMAAVLDVVDAGIITADASGRVASLNAEAVRLLDGPISEVGELLGDVPEIIPYATDGGAVTVELQPSSQPDRWLRVTRHDRPGSDPAVVLVMRDITDVRRSRALRETFLGMLSHELRTPVTSIHAAATMLRTRGDRLGAETQAELIGDITEESDRLLRLVEDLLVLAHFDEGVRLIQEPGLLQRVVPPVIEREQRRWPHVGMDLRIEPDLPVVVGDETSVQQVVRNLISNAAKYGGGHIVIEITRATEDPGKSDGAGIEGGAEIHVLDDGPGVEPEEANALFRPFFRSPRLSGGTGGAGIGLYVCHQLVTAMGGRIWARRRKVGGSDFGFWLPEYQYEADD